LTDVKKRYTATWTAQRQERHSAPMSEAEVQKLAARLRGEGAEAVAVHEAPARPQIRFQRSG
jgi:hypothetical protein